MWTMSVHQRTRAHGFDAKRLASVFACLCFLLSSVGPALANEANPVGLSNSPVSAATNLAHGRNSPVTGAVANLGALRARFDLNLTSTAASIVLGTRLFRGADSITINVGGADQTFRAGQQVTAAQLVAIKQVLAGGQQSLSLNSQGAATGGSFSLNQGISGRVNDLVIPQNVSVIFGAR